MIQPKRGDLVKVTSSRWGCIPDKYYKVLGISKDSEGTLVVKLRNGSGTTLWHWINKDFVFMDENDIDFYKQ